MIEGVHFLPKPGTALVESRVEFAVDDVAFLGYVDAVWPGVKADHKFVRTFDWQLTAADLARDPAALIYAYAAPRFERTTLRWIYYSKSGKGAQVTEISLTSSEIEDRFRARVLPVARRMVAWQQIFAGIRDVHIAARVPAHPENCYKYGRMCHYTPHCNLMR